MSTVMDGDRNIAFLAALLGSIAIHAVLLFMLPVRMRLEAPPAPPEPILARLAEPAEAAKPAPEKRPPVTAPAAVPKAEPRVAKPLPRKERKAKPRAKPPAKKALPVITEPEAPPPTAPPLAVAPRPAPTIQRPERAEPAPLPAPVPPGSRAAEPRHEVLLADYRAQLLGAARRFKRYPSVARDNGWEGEAVVRIVIGEGAAEAELALSSGHAVLDRQALEMFRRALRLVPLPAELQGKPISVELRAVYRLDDQGSG